LLIGNIKGHPAHQAGSGQRKEVSRPAGDRVSEVSKRQLVLEIRKGKPNKPNHSKL
jgi:hypothetical protein